VQYWYGIKDALTAQGATVLCASVPPSSSIEDRAAKLRDDIDASTRTTDGSRAEKVNIIAHSMGGLDARYMIRHLPPRTAEIASLVTVSTPHRGSHFADAVLDEDAANGPLYLPRLYGLLERAGLDTAAFAQLTRAYMTGTFNPATPDRDSVQYFSYGARCDEPPLLSPFRRSWQLVRDAEGANDGLVSVESSQWGAYRGTLVGVSHLDLINWSNRVRWTLREWMGMKRNFNAIAFYLDIADMLAKEGL
jgi:triacylglycerol lipase